jgi:hypothetical protein
MRYMCVTKTPRVAIVHGNYQRVEPSPPYPSAGLPCDTLMDIRGWRPHYPSMHLLGMVGCGPTQRSSKLLSLQDSIYPVCSSTYLLIVPQGPTDAGLNQHRRGYHLWSFEHNNIPLPDLPIRYSPLSPSCPAQFHIKLSINYSSSKII